LLLDLCGIAVAGFETTFLMVAADILMIAAGAIGAVVEGPKKYVFFLFSMCAFMPILYFLAYALKAKARAAGAHAANVFEATSTLTILTWSAYPVVWVLADGTRMISPDAECVIYTALDIAAKSVFGFLVVRSHAGIGESMAVMSGGKPAVYGALGE
jgi:bacteriorhodopsin